VSQAGDISHGLSRRRIAVLYFEDASKGGTLAHVATGLTESLINRLSQVGELDVVSADGVAPYQRTKLTADSIARALGAGTIVRGSVEEDGDQLRVSARLVDGQSGVSLEPVSFHVPPSAVLNARDSLSGAVADLLRKQLGDEVRLREQRSATTNVQAWLLVQRVENSRKLAYNLTAESDVPGAMKALAEADSLAAQAALLDPKWTEPLIQRGWSAYQSAQLLTKNPRQALALIDTALAYATRAIAIDLRSADAFELRGTAGYERVRSELLVDQKAINGAIAAAESDLRQAVGINRRQASAWNALSLVEYGRYNVAESNNAARRAYEEDAYLRVAASVVYRLWATSYDMEQFTDAIHWCEVGQQRFPKDYRFARCQLYLMLTTAVKGDPKDAWRLVGEISRLTPKLQVEMNRREAEMIAAVVIGRAGLPDSADHVLKRARAGKDVDPNGELIGVETVARAQLGENDQALSLLERYLTNHPDHRDFTKANPWWWRELRKDPRFAKLAGVGS